MNAMWVSLKESVNCGSKLTDVVHRPQGGKLADVVRRRQRGKLTNVVPQPENFVDNRSYTAEEENSESKLVHQMENPMHEMIFKSNYGQNRFSELNIGDPSRNIIEMIFRAALTNSSKQSRKIKTVLRVKNSIEILERFENYREMVKKKAYEQYKRHPRSMVDGNELLRFYGTTMTCCYRKPNLVSELCKDPTCRVCRIIQSSFDTDNTKTGIQLSTSSEAVSENMIVISRGENMKRAVIVCRTIAGRVVNMVDGEIEEDYDSTESEGLPSECLIVRNPSAILPCFVVVFT